MVVTGTSHFNMALIEESFSVGRVFTPPKWATWCAEKFKVYESWREGSTIFDPTCGQGVFFLSLLSIAEDRRQTVQPNDLSRLFGVEIIPGDKSKFLERVHSRFGLEFPTSNFITMDFMDFGPHQVFDIAAGNPPWVNFSDLPTYYKEKLKVDFLKYGLVKSRKDVLLGASRADLAALIIQKCMRDHIREDGRGFFFIPLSLFFNEDANKHFRPAKGADNVFSVEEMYDFENGYVFNQVNTRNGFVFLKRKKQQAFPVPMYKIGRNDEETKLYCAPTLGDGAWMQSHSADGICDFNLISILDNQVPRQGMNTGGLNKVFLLERERTNKSVLAPIEKFSNGYGVSVEISTDFVFPLMNGRLFRGRIPKKERYILCLHDKDGSPLPFVRIAKLFGVLEYILQYAKEMKNRRGVLIQSQIRKGYFWSLLGVGPYSFSPFKVAWESLGKHSFHAVVVDGSWQGNQAMHAYIPAYNHTDALRICDDLNVKVPAYLRLFGMEGTCNWAQPGRIKRLLTVRANQLQLFSNP